MGSHQNSAPFIGPPFIFAKERLYHIDLISQWYHNVNNADNTGGMNTCSQSKQNDECVLTSHESSTMTHQDFLTCHGFSIRERLQTQKRVQVHKH